MVKHIVMWNLNCSAEEKDSVANKIKTGLEGLKSEIDVIQDIRVGININLADKDAKDICLIVDVMNMEDLKIYGGHEKHLEVLKGIKEYLLERTVIDIEN